MNQTLPGLSIHSGISRASTKRCNSKAVGKIYLLNYLVASFFLFLQSTKKNQIGSSFTKALFRFKFFLDFDTVPLSFLFNKYCPIMK